MSIINYRVDGKVALVTGGGRGIGESIAYTLSQAGAKVIITSRTMIDLEKVQKNIEQGGGEALPLQLDLQKVSEIYNVVDESIAKMGRIDILVNCAGINIRAKAEEYTENDWDTVLNTNLKGTFFMSQAVANKSMIPQKKGKIVNINSNMAFVGNYDRAAYCSSKGGILQLTRTLAIEWSKYNINVNGVAPTWVYTEMTRKILDNREVYEREIQKIPLNRIGETKDVDAAVLFLASEASDFIQGHTISVDGGYIIW